jgi:hypothetical protein
MIAAAKNGDDGMKLPRDELLHPSLQDATIPKAPYSVYTVFVTSAFGGPLAAIAITALNSYRLRLIRDVAPLSLALITYLAFLAALTDPGWGLTSWISYRNFHVLFPAAVLAYGYLSHRLQQRSADVLGLKRPNGWIAGLPCALGGNIVFFVLLAYGVLPHGERG